MLTHTDFIEVLVKIYKPQSYLELGVYVGETFKRIERLVSKAVAVDMDKRFTPVKGTFFVGTTSEYFNTHTDSFDMIFIDANHDYDFVKQDLYNSLNILSSNGILALHDTDPEDKSLLAHNKCSDSYKIVDEIDTNKYFTFTFPLTEAGITIITLRKNRRCLVFT